MIIIQCSNTFIRLIGVGGGLSQSLEGFERGESVWTVLIGGDITKVIASPAVGQQGR